MIFDVFQSLPSKSFCRSSPSKVFIIIETLDGQVTCTDNWGNPCSCVVKNKDGIYEYFEEGKFATGSGYGDDGKEYFFVNGQLLNGIGIVNDKKIYCGYWRCFHYLRNEFRSFKPSWVY